MESEPTRDRRRSATGGCLCGAVRYTIDGPVRDVLHCHCVNCRRVSGNFVATTGCATDDLTVEGEASLSWYDLGYARYAFCRRCGARLFWVGADHPDRISVGTGTLDDASGLALAAVWFANEAQDHHLLDDRVPHFEGNGDTDGAAV